jgi:hypothetical protein
VGTYKSLEGNSRKKAQLENIYGWKDDYFKNGSEIGYETVDWI